MGRSALPGLGKGERSISPLGAIRPTTIDDARSILEIHRAAVLRTAAPQYAPDILAAWAASLDPDNMRRMTKIVASRSELILVADAGRALAGFGSIVPKNAVLPAVYVSP
jgi:hypothetical protein